MVNEYKNSCGLTILLFYGFYLEFNYSVIQLFNIDMRQRKFALKFVWLVIFVVGVSFFSFGQRTLTIEQALDIAEENNPQMISSKLSLERTQFNLEAQRASLKSQFSLNVNPIGYSNTRSFDNRDSEWYTNESLSTQGTFQVRQPILLTDGEITLTNTFGWQDSRSDKGGDTRNKAFTNNLQLRLNQPLFTYNRQQMELTRLEFDHENAGIRYALQRLNTERSITQQFYLVYMAQRNLEISQAELLNSNQNYEIIKEKVEADLSAREELAQAEVNLANAQSSVESRIVSLDNAKDQLKQTLGLPLGEDINVIADIQTSPMIVSEGQAIQSGLASRMELRQREIDMELQELTMITTKALNEFRGDLSLSIGIIGDHEKLGNIYDNPTQSPRVSISFAIPIFDWGEKKARVKAQQTTQTIAKLEYENQKINIELDIRQTLRSLNNLRIQIDIAEKNVQNSQFTYDLNQIRYREGDLTGLQMSQYQTQLSSSQISQLQAYINYKIELLNLKILTLYDFENDKPVVPVKNLTLAVK
jgi:outer membrane protein TolC